MKQSAKSQPLVSVVIPCYNQARFLAAAVESVLNQTYRHVEIVVVDDGSSDDTAAVAQSFGGPVKYVYRDNGGLSAARNTGMEHVTGKYVNFLDADDTLLPDKIAPQVELLEADPKLALVYCWYHWTDEAGVRYDVMRKTPHRGHVYHELRKGNWMPVHTVLVRRSCLEEAGPFDTTLRSCEDWDVWLRIALRHPMDLVDEPLVEYRNVPGSMSKNYWRMVCHTLRVLEIHRQDHPGCAECRAVDAWVRQDYGQALKLHAWKLQSEGEHRLAATWYGYVARVHPQTLANRNTVRDLTALARALVGPGRQRLAGG